MFLSLLAIVHIGGNTLKPRPKGLSPAGERKMCVKTRHTHTNTLTDIHTFTRYKIHGSGVKKMKNHKICGK